MADAVETAPVVARTEGACLRIRLRELRGERSLTEVARLVGIRGDELGRIERGETSQIRFTTLLRILTALDCSPEMLLEVQRPAHPALRYLEALDAYLDGDLPAGPRRRARRRDDGLEEQDPAEAGAYTEADAPSRARRGIATLHR